MKLQQTKTVDRSSDKEGVPSARVASLRHTITETKYLVSSTELADRLIQIMLRRR